MHLLYGEVLNLYGFALFCMDLYYVGGEGEGLGLQNKS